jgi:hypothetical protein
VLIKRAYTVADQVSSFQVPGDGLVVRRCDVPYICIGGELGIGDFLGAGSVRLHQRIDSGGRSVQGIQRGNIVYRGTKDHYKNRVSRTMRTLDKLVCLLGGQMVDSLKEAFLAISHAASSANFLEAVYQVPPAVGSSDFRLSQ